jgi:hypothetical protein
LAYKFDEQLILHGADGFTEGGLAVKYILELLNYISAFCAALAPPHQVGHVRGMKRH